MSTAMDVVGRARGLGIDLHIDSGQLRFKAPGGLPDDLKGELRQHKAEIIDLLTGKEGGAVEAARPLPRWCRADCPGLETIPLAKEGDVAGCVHPVTGTWRRLDWMKQCPAMEKATRPALPEWCNARCENYHQADAEYCCREIDETHWRRDRIDTMKSCPRIGRI